MKDAVLRLAPGQPAQQTCQDIYDALTEFQNGAPQFDDVTLLAVSEALDRLAGHDPVGAELIKLRFFAGMPNVEAARVMRLVRTDRQTRLGLCPSVAL